MSQNKTVFPGVGSEGDYNQGQGWDSPQQQPYSRNPQPAQGGTVFPGMTGGDYGRQGQPAPEREPQQPRPRPAAGGKPVVGFLYSISRTGAGEYWPLHVGPNVIGNGPECDIVLGEGTVSKRHANLHINKMKRPEKTEATISDLGSTNGTLVNENSVSMAAPVICQNGDIITIGDNYDLLLLLIDTKAMGLHLAPNFIDVRNNEEEEMYEQGPSAGGYSAPGANNATRNEQDFPRFYGPDSPYSGASRPSDSTVGLDPGQGGFSHGGTVGME